MITQETGFFTRLKSPMQCFDENPVSASIAIFSGAGAGLGDCRF